MLEPVYHPQVTATFEKIETDQEQRGLWNAVCDAIDLICDQPGSAEARREAIRFGRESVFQVPVRSPDNWVVIWHPRGAEAFIDYVGLRPLRR